MRQDIAIIIGGSLAALAVIAAFIVAISAAKG